MINSKEINRVTIDIEHPNGNSYMGFEIIVHDNGTVEIGKTENCSLADCENDYLFDTENELMRVQADDFCYEVNDNDREIYGGNGYDEIIGRIV